MAARFIDDLAKCFLAMIEFDDQLFVRHRFFDRVQILALDIFDQRNLERFRIGKFADHHGDFVQSCALGGTPAALAGDDLISLAARTHHDRLNDAMRCDRLGQFVQRCLIEMAARLSGVRGERADRHGSDILRRFMPAFILLRLRAVSEQCAQSATKAGAGFGTSLFRIDHAAFAALGSR